MKSHLTTLLFLGLSFLLATACTSQSNRLIAEGEQRWRSHGITGYKIDVLKASIWHAQNHRLTVREGEIIDATATCNPAPLERGQCEVEDFDAEDFTVEGLFRIAREKSSIAGGKWTEIELDETYGFPVKIFFDSDDAIDEEVAWRVMNFETWP